MIRVVHGVAEGSVFHLIKRYALIGNPTINHASHVTSGLRFFKEGTFELILLPFIVNGEFRPRKPMTCPRGQRELVIWLGLDLGLGLYSVSHHYILLPSAMIISVCFLVNFLKNILFNEDFL